MVLMSKISTPLPAAIPNINRKTWLKILGITLENLPDKWDIHFEEMIDRASGRMYIPRVCKYYGMSMNLQLNLLFNILIMSLFIYGIEPVWGGTYSKYINQIEKFIIRAYRNGYIAEKFNFSEIISDRKLWMKIINNKDNALQELLPNK